MTDDIIYKNNPLHGVSLKTLVTEIVDHYGFEILHAYLGLNCFKTKPSIESSVKFLKKTDWAREKVEGFYLYQFKQLPRASADQFALPPRDRIVPSDQKPREPAKLSLEDAERLREKREQKAAERKQNASRRSDTGKRFGAARHSRDKPKSNGQSSQIWQQKSHHATEPASSDQAREQPEKHSIWQTRSNPKAQSEHQETSAPAGDRPNPWGKRS